MSNKRYYIKKNPEKELLPEIVKTKTIPPSSSQQQSSLYTKPEATQLPQAFIVIFSGGEKTEKQYFKQIKNSNIKIEIFTEPNFNTKTNNLTFNPRIFDFAYNKVAEYKESASPESPDQFYIVTDVDHFKEAIMKNRAKCEKGGIKLIISNPCFEVWLYYSCHSDKFLKFKSTPKVSSGEVKKFVHMSVKGGLDIRKTISNIEQNIVNAKNNYTEDNQKFPTLFSTQMFHLAQSILSCMKPTK